MLSRAEIILLWVIIILSCSGHCGTLGPLYSYLYSFPIVIDHAGNPGKLINFIRCGALNVVVFFVF